MSNIKVKKQQKTLDDTELNEFTKEQFIEKIRSLQAHNTQLKNLLSKNVANAQQNKVITNNFDFTKCQFRHILLKFCYLGWDYQGYVVQEDTTNTIEHQLFDALIKTCLIKDRAMSNYHRCGRTDKGVSSFEQVISINVRSKLPQESLNRTETEIDYCSTLNRVLPENIQCVAWCPVNTEFSARFDCKGRVYKYFFPKGNLNIEAMRIASKSLEGTHDFRNFCKMDVGNGVVEFTRRIMSIDIQTIDDCEEINEFSMFVITIKGKAFLWHQIRCIMGVLFLIGEGKEDADVINDLLNVDKNPRKPEYGMASELPLNLYHSEYDLETNWIVDNPSLLQVIKKLKNQWTFYNIKATMIKSMIQDLNTSNNLEDTSDMITTSLLQEVKKKKYIPLLKRQKCQSLENKIEHFVKRSRLEIENKSND